MVPAGPQWCAHCDDLSLMYPFIFPWQPVISPHIDKGHPKTKYSLKFLGLYMIYAFLSDVGISPAVTAVIHIHFVIWFSPCVNINEQILLGASSRAAHHSWMTSSLIMFSSARAHDNESSSQARVSFTCVFLPVEQNHHHLCFSQYDESYVGKMSIMANSVHMLFKMTLYYLSKCFLWGQSILKSDQKHAFK